MKTGVRMKRLEHYRRLRQLCLEFEAETLTQGEVYPTLGWMVNIYDLTEIKNDGAYKRIFHLAPELRPNRLEWIERRIKELEDTK